ncbi:CFI-box-CTERM domain-containing protein [Sporofaciens musculi]|nr:CFI-box-CTERM domain-containing protein [Sporofaciens musculi]
MKSEGRSAEGRLMEETRKKLEDFFDEMVKSMKYFKKKSYEQYFKDTYEKYRDLFMSLPALCEGEEETASAAIEELASVIPMYARRKFLDVPKQKKEPVGIDYNMAMAVYVVPMLVYQHEPVNEQIAQQMVEIWNESQVTGLRLQKSDYEKIAGGFRKGLCYITTAVCECQGKSDDCRELTILRRYRDDYLMQSKEGRAMVEEYYEIAPALVLSIGMHKEPWKIYQEIYEDYLCPCVEYAKNEENVKCRELYGDMVGSLRQRFAPSHYLN